MVSLYHIFQQNLKFKKKDESKVVIPVQYIGSMNISLTKCCLKLPIALILTICYGFVPQIKIKNKKNFYKKSHESADYISNIVLNEIIITNIVKASTSYIVWKKQKIITVLGYKIHHKS